MVRAFTVLLIGINPLSFEYLYQNILTFQTTRIQCD
jgi:hypothetical protein